MPDAAEALADGDGVLIAAVVFATPAFDAARTVAVAVAGCDDVDDPEEDDPEEDEEEPHSTLAYVESRFFAARNSTKPAKSIAAIKADWFTPNPRLRQSCHLSRLRKEPGNDIACQQR